MEIAEIMQRDLKDPRVGLATCTRVQVSGDLKVAKIYVSVLGTPEEQKRAMAALDGASGFVRRLLGQRLALRVSPELRFTFDPSVEYGIRLEKLIEETRGNAPDDSPYEADRPDKPDQAEEES
jgi:ribosome-binding factor A